MKEEYGDVCVVFAWKHGCSLEVDAADFQVAAAALPPRPLLPAVHRGDHLHLGAARGAVLPVATMVLLDGDD